MCGIYPPDPTTEVGQVRLWSGDSFIDSSGNYLVSDEVIESFLAKYSEKTSEKRIYFATLDTMFLMKRALTPTAMRMREREGGVEKEMYGRERYDVLCDAYKELKKDPSIIVTDFVAAGVRMGGVDKQEMARVKADPLSNLPPCSITPRDRIGNPEDEDLI